MAREIGPVSAPFKKCNSISTINVTFQPRMPKNARQNKRNHHI